MPVRIRFLRVVKAQAIPLTSWQRFSSSNHLGQSNAPLFNDLANSILGQQDAFGWRGIHKHKTNGATGNFMASPTKEINKALPRPSSDFHQLVETLSADELAVVKQLRTFMASGA